MTYPPKKFYEVDRRHRRWRRLRAWRRFRESLAKWLVAIAGHVRPPDHVCQQCARIALDTLAKLENEVKNE